MTDTTQIDLTAKYRDGVNYKMEQPVKSKRAEFFEDALESYGAAYDEATSRHWYRGNASELRRNPEAFEELWDDLERRISELNKAKGFLRVVGTHEFALKGRHELDDYETACWKWHEYQRALNQHDPENDTVRAVAEALVKDEAILKAGKKRKEYPLFVLDRLALVRGMERDEILTLARDYIEANPMRYAVTTGNLTYLKKGGN